MALVVGTNCGFVTVAPTADPAGTALTASDNTTRCSKFTAPAGATSVTEIGWWCNNATEEANFEVGLYSDDGAGATSVPVTLQSGASKTNAKGTGAGWKVKTGLSITVTAGVIYWIAYQLDDTATATETDGATGGGRRGNLGGTTLPDPTWSGGSFSDNLIAIYGVYASSASTVKQLAAMGVG